MALFVACGTFSPQQTNQPTVTSTATFTIVPHTPTGSPTEPPIPTGTATPTETTLPLYTLDGLRMAYVVDGNIYLQDSGAQPVQLTSSGMDGAPYITSDGKRVIFYRGKLYEDTEVWMINIDGSGEELLIPSPALSNLGYGKYTEVNELYYFHKSNQLIFSTRDFKPSGDKASDVNRIGARSNNDLLLLNVDSGVLKRILFPADGYLFLLSPDEKRIAVQRKGLVDIIDTHGQTLRRNLITYPYPDGYSFFSLPLYWTADSSQLITMLPIYEADYPPDDGPDQLNVWKYPLDGRPPVKILLDPPPIGNELDFNISPDGNWITYSYYNYPGKTDPTITEGVYLGNLQAGSTLFLGGFDKYDHPHFVWSPDSTHFIIICYTLGMFMSDTQGEVTSLKGHGFLGWVDDRRYLFGDVFIGEIGQEKTVKVAQLPSDFSPTNPAYFRFVFLGK